ncbi:hypothetical protein MKX01_010977 [Papaver californicum]|nr:hypothetical protein MKX01_010977 [Papaver californicum]
MKDQESEISFEEIFRYLVEGTARMMKDEAELKFTDRDAESALADAYIASELKPNLPGIQQQIAAYKVHVAASVVIQIDHRNNTSDWYAILGITDEDDDLIDIEIIKKKYKRMALMVHPDKNESVAAKTVIKHNEVGETIIAVKTKKENRNINSQGEEVKFKSGYSKSRFYFQKEADYSSDEEDTYDDCEIHEYETRTCPHCSSMCEVDIEGRRILSIITCRTCKKMFFRDSSI